MKQILSILLAAMVFTSCINKEKPKIISNEAAAADTANYTTIQWLDSIVNFGTINMGQEILVKFRFKNTGNKPLILTNVSAGCGCTVPDYSREPIPPNGEGWVSGSFDTKKVQTGEVHKSISVATNTKYKQQHVLLFNGTIKEGDGTATPPSVPTPIPNN